MKKLVLFYLSLIILFSSCGEKHDTLSVGEYSKIKTREFTYKKHTYIYFVYSECNGRDAQEIVHDPDCKYCLSLYD